LEFFKRASFAARAVAVNAAALIQKSRKTDRWKTTQFVKRGSTSQRQCFDLRLLGGQIWEVIEKRSTCGSRQTDHAVLAGPVAMFCILLFMGLHLMHFRSLSPRLPTNNSLWASKTGNSGLTESVTCEACRCGVSGQAWPRGGVYTTFAQIPRTGPIPPWKPDSFRLADHPRTGFLCDYKGVWPNI
jgi:hypothetical protein